MRDVGGGGAPMFGGSAKGGYFGGGRSAGRAGYRVAPNGSYVGRIDRGQRYSGAYQKHGGTYYDKHGHRHHHRRFAYGVPLFGFYDGYYDNYADYDDCYQVRRVRTSHGWRWRRFYVCDYRY